MPEAKSEFVPDEQRSSTLEIIQKSGNVSGDNGGQCVQTRSTRSQNIHTESPAPETNNEMKAGGQDGPTITSTQEQAKHTLKNAEVQCRRKHRSILSRQKNVVKESQQPFEKQQIPLGSQNYDSTESAGVELQPRENKDDSAPYSAQVDVVLQTVAQECRNIDASGLNHDRDGEAESANEPPTPICSALNRSNGATPTKWETSIVSAQAMDIAAEAGAGSPVCEQLANNATGVDDLVIADLESNSRPGVACTTDADSDTPRSRQGGEAKSSPSESCSSDQMELDASLDLKTEGTSPCEEDPGSECPDFADDRCGCDGGKE